MTLFGFLFISFVLAAFGYIVLIVLMALGIILARITETIIRLMQSAITMTQEMKTSTGIYLRTKKGELL